MKIKFFTSTMLALTFILGLISIINLVNGDFEEALRILLFALLNIIYLKLDSIGGEIHEQTKERK